ncbi:MAG: hypothetical protein LBS33_03530 [Streptococcaceae bacterium]|jgi:hypothetical protein|nr:hypothetical protein [Streptococcaceae bacterium]
MNKKNILVAGISLIGLIVLFVKPNHVALETKTAGFADETQAGSFVGWSPSDNNCQIAEKAQSFKEMSTEEQRDLLNSLPEGAILVDENGEPIK